MQLGLRDIAKVVCTLTLASTLAFVSSPANGQTPAGNLTAGAAEVVRPATAGPLYGPATAEKGRRVRVAQPAITDALLGAIAYLEDFQIRFRPGRGHLLSDASDLGDGCKGEMLFNLPWRESIGLPLPPVIQARNRAGEWASTIHFLPKKTGIKGRTLVAVQDSNLFMTAFIAYPLFLFDDATLPENRRPTSSMLPKAVENIASFKRGNAYNFWATLPGAIGKAERTGPFNIPVKMIEQLGKAFCNPKFDKFWTWLTRGLKAPPKYWVERCLDAKENPTGADALFNIPNDADDTSTAVAFQKLYADRFPNTGVKPDLAALAAVAEWRDVNRDREDGRDNWKGKESGAYLTWMKDERAPIFATPETGVIPLGVNNVDCVVNANVCFSLAANGMTDLPGYAAALDLLARAIEQRTWPEAGLYYPQYMIFPYAVTRAWRDGGAHAPRLDTAMGKLLRDLLDAQDAWAKANPKRLGAFPGGEDRSDHLATALGLTSLLNIGRSLADRHGLTARYDRAIANAVSYLVRVGRDRDFQYPTTRELFPGKRQKSKQWESGLFFAASFWDLGHWRSEAFTIAMVAEALGKYLLAYDLDTGRFAERRLRLLDNRTAAYGICIQ